MCYDLGMNKSISKLVGEQIKRYRVQNGITMPALANESGISKGGLSKIENGTGNPTVETLQKIYSAMNYRRSVPVIIRDFEKLIKQ